MDFPSSPVRARVGLLAFGIITFVAGCALKQSTSQEVSAVLEHHRSDRATMANAYSSTPRLGASVESPRAPDDTDPETLATLRDYIVHALEHNPGISAAEETAHAKAARVPQVTALPDPLVSTKTLPEPIRTAEGDNFFILGVSQKLPIPEKLNRAGRIAVQETRMALERLQQTRLRVIAGVKRAHFQLYILDKSIAITRSNQELLLRLIDVARSQVAAARRTQDDVLRAQVELSSLEAELIDLRRRRATTAAALNALLDRNPTEPIPAPAEFDLRRTDLKVAELLARAAEHNPDLKRFQRQIERDREAVKLAELAYWPDFNLGFEWISMKPRDAFVPPLNPATGRRPVVSQMSEAGSDNWAVTFGFTLPIWYDKIKAGIEEARRNLAASNRRLEAARNDVYVRVDDALADITAGQKLAELFKNTIIPQAEQAYRVSQSSYTAGQTDFLNVIDNWRKWLVFTIQYHRALGELEQGVADLEEAIGLSLSEFGASP